MTACPHCDGPLSGEPWERWRWCERCWLLFVQVCDSGSLPVGWFTVQYPRPALTGTSE